MASKKERIIESYKNLLGDGCDLDVRQGQGRRRRPLAFPPTTHDGVEKTTGEKGEMFNFSARLIFCLPNKSKSEIESRTAERKSDNRVTRCY
jgi:hypothetical protein